MQKKKPVRFSIFVYDINEFLTYIWHWLEIVFSHIEKIVYLVLANSVYALYGECIVVNANDNSSAFSISKS